MAKNKKPTSNVDLFYEFLSDLSSLVSSNMATVYEFEDGGTVLHVNDCSLQAIFERTLSRIGVVETEEKIQNIVNDIIKNNFWAKIMQPNGEKRGINKKILENNKSKVIKCFGDFLYLCPDKDSIDQVESLFNTVGTHSPSYSALFSGDKSGEAIFCSNTQTETFKSLVCYDSVFSQSPLHSLDFKIENASNAPYINVLAMALLSTEEREKVFLNEQIPVFFAEKINVFLDKIRSKYEVFRTTKKNAPTIPVGPQILVPKKNGTYLAVSPLGSGKIFNEINERIDKLSQNGESRPDYTGGYDLMAPGKARNNFYVVPTKVFVSTPPSIDYDISNFFALAKNSEKVFSNIAKYDLGVTRRLSLLGRLAVRFDKRGAGSNGSFLRKKKRNAIEFIARRLAEETKESFQKYRETHEIDSEVFVCEMAKKISRWINTHEEALKPLNAKGSKKRVLAMRQELLDQTYSKLIEETLNTIWNGESHVGSPEI